MNPRNLEVKWAPWDGRGLGRLDLGVGESSEIAVVYVDVPNMRVDASGQRYTCLERNAGGLYRYEDQGLFRGFTADLAVDALFG